MEKGLVFEPSYRDRYTNVMHAQFQNDMYRIVSGSSIPLDKLYLTEALMAEWKESIDLEVDINRTVSSSADTPRLADQNTERVGFVTFLFQRIRTAAKSPYVEEREAGEDLLVVVDEYNRLQQEPMESMTLHIEGLLLDLGQDKYKSAIELLQLENIIADLAASNAAYTALRDQRLATKASEKLPPAREVRPLTDAIQDHVFFCIQAGYLFATSSDDKAAIAELANLLNTHIASLRTAHNQSYAQKYGAGTGTGSGTGGTTPGGSTPGGTTPDTNPDGTTPDGGTPGDGSSTPDDTTPGGGDEGGSDQNPDSGSPDTGGTDTDNPGGDTSGGGQTPPDTGGDDDEEVVG